MDKYEYRVRAEQIKSLLAEHAYAEAKEVCDSIDWKRVKNFSMLCTVSEIYKINRNYEDARDILLLAYDRYPSGKKIVYALCELAIKMNEPVQAIEYYKEFCQIAPKDTGKYILQYKIYEAQDVSLEERILVLEEYKKKEYRERWAYELARLYDLIGAEAKCVEECDELILWFGEGKYVQKALELKMRHRELTASQQIKYDRMTGIDEDEEFFNEASESEDTNQEYEDDKVQDEEVFPANEPDSVSTEDISISVEKQPTQEIPVVPDEDGIIPTADPNTIQVKPVNVGEYSTMNLQAEISKSLQELLGEETSPNENMGVRLEKVEEPAEEITDSSTDSEEAIDQNANTFISEIVREPGEIYAPSDISKEEQNVADLEPTSVQPESVSFQSNVEFESDESTEKVAEDNSDNPMDNVLAQEYDGQISLVVPEPEMVEKQITGQIDISEYLADWDKQCKESQRERIAGAIRKSMENTNHILLPLEKILPGITGPLPDVEEIAKEVVLPTDEVKEATPMEELLNSEQEDLGIEEIEEVEEVIPDDIASLAEESEEVNDTENLIEEEFFENDEDEKETDNLDYYEDKSDELVEEDSENDGEDEVVIPDIEYSMVDDSEESDSSEENIEEESVVENLQDTSEDEIEQEEEEEESEASEDSEDDSDEISDEESADSVEFSQEEMEELFGSLLKIRKVPGRIINSLKNSSMEPLFGNIVITGNEKDTRIKLALGLAKCKQRSEVDFEGKVAKISADVLNSKDVSKALKSLNKGALLIEDAGSLEAETLDSITKTLSSPEYKMLIILEDKKSEIEKLAGLRTYFSKMYDVRINIPAFSNQDLVSHAKEYALEREYTIDEMGVLELYTRIDELQTSNHFVTISEVEDIMDRAIAHVNKKTLSHFKDVLFAKRYDENDLIILRDKDFQNV